MDWSTMIPDLLKRISDRLPHCFDYLNFRLVCTHWRSAAGPKKFPPVLIVPSNPDSGDLRFFDPADGSVHPLPLPESARNKIICGASRGWLTLMDDTTKSMSLVNPITGVQYPLPSAPQKLVFGFHDRIDGILDDSDDDGIGARRFMKEYCISDVFLSSAPNSGAECIVMARQSGLERFVFCRPGDAVWTPVRSSYEVCQVVAFWNGRFYAVDRDEDVFALEFGPRDEGVTAVEPVMLPFSSKPYKLLLECNGELLLLYVDLDDEVHPLIYRCDDLREGLTWSEVGSLGNHTLFLSRDSRTGFLGHEPHGCKGNCIYVSKPGFRETGEDHHIQMMDIANGVSHIILSYWLLQRPGSSRRSWRSSRAFFWFKPNVY